MQSYRERERVSFVLSDCTMFLAPNPFLSSRLIKSSHNSHTPSGTRNIVRGFPILYRVSPHPLVPVHILRTVNPLQIPFPFKLHHNLTLTILSPSKQKVSQKMKLNLSFLLILASTARAKHTQNFDQKGMCGTTGSRYCSAQHPSLFTSTITS